MNNIHATAIIGNRVSIGKGNYIGPNVIIEGDCEIGNNNWIGPGTYIGVAPELRTFNHFDKVELDLFKVRIGSENVIRENCVVQSSVDGETAIGDGNFLMSGCHVSHDCKIGNQVTLAQKVILAGYSFIQDNANVGSGAIIRQRLVIGQYSMVGMGSLVTKNLPPFGLYYGSPCKYVRPNEKRVSELQVFSDDFYKFIGLSSTDWPNDVPTQIIAILKDFESKVGLI